MERPSSLLTTQQADPFCNNPDIPQAMLTIAQVLILAYSCLRWRTVLAVVTRGLETACKHAAYTLMLASCVLR
jgi:hypothetical protein